MALRFRTRLYLTIVSLVFLVIAVLSGVMLFILGYDMWQSNWRSGATMTVVTTASVERAINLPAYIQKRIAEQLTAQAVLIAELTESMETAGAPASDLLGRLNNARMSAAAAGTPLEAVVVTDAQGRALVAVGDPSAAVMDTLPVMTPGAVAVARVDEPEPGVQGDQYVYAPLPHRAGTVAVGMSREALIGVLRPFALNEALNQFMVTGEFGSNYKRMAVVNKDGKILASVEREGSAASPQLLREITEFCTQFLGQLLEDPEQAYRTGFIGGRRDVSVVTPVVLDATDEVFALYVEHDTSQQLEYLLDRFGVLAVVGTGILVLALITSIFLSRGLSKPLIELARGAREFGSGNFNYRLRMKRKDEFSDLAQSFNTMAISIQEYVHELQQETSRRERLESEFRIAADLQQTLLPEAAPRVEGVELLGWSQPSKDVGGDFFDYFELPNGRIGIVLGDATGKGLGAALLSTQCSSILRTLAAQDLPPAELLSLTNNEFYKRVGSTHKFVTLFILTLDPETGMATYASAGHPPAFLTNPESKASRWLESEAGYPLGIVKDATFSEVTVRLDPRDTIVIYSDGVTDAQDPSRQLFGEKRLEDAVKRYASLPPQELLDGLRSATTHHMYGKDPIDDMTVVIVRFDPLVTVAAAMARDK